ncbi:hypothetical protein WJX81_004647 [Elliptochloris bilobata]|uniref:nicotinamidase n=1 Tax=Elliptochloris bilobata TaxID=381761 RepID=A0AAW1SLJ1_9CHLO
MPAAGQKALLVIDVQNDFLPGGALAAPGGDRIIPLVNALLDSPAFDVRVASADWHPKGHISFASTHGKAPGDTVHHCGITQLLWPVHCVQGSHGAELSSALKVSGWDRLVRKGSERDADASSPFRDLHGKDLGLAAYLLERGVQEVYVCGLVTEVCVRAAALDAAHERFATYVVADASGALEQHPGDEARVHDELRDAGVAVVTTADVLQRCQGKAR